MTEKSIKRYSREQIRAMIDAGQYQPIAPDAPTFDLDEDFWKNAKPAASNRTETVELRLKPATIDHFKKSGPDYLDRMADILEQQAKKAS